MISIIVMNSNDYLITCMQSILTQSYNDFEIICVINSNNNQSLELLNSNFDDTRIKIIKTELGGDNSRFMNVGLKHANGEYVVFLQDNQILNENALKIVIDLFNTSNVDLIVSKINYVSSEGDLSSYNKVLKNYEIPKKLLFEFLDKRFIFFYKNSFLNKYNIQFYDENAFMSKELSNLKAIVSSNEIYISDKDFVYELDISSDNNTIRFNANIFKEVIDLVIANKDFYNSYKDDFWNYIFGNIFIFSGTIRNYYHVVDCFRDSKILFDDYCLNKGFFSDIYCNLDISATEFFNQTLDDIYYLPKKREALNKLAFEKFNSLKIAIKSPNPTDNQTWGDYFFALSLKKSFEKKGFKVFLHQFQDWYTNKDDEDIVIVLRGLRKYIPNDKHINIMWNISHPEAVDLDEYESYDIVFIASLEYTKVMDEKLDTNVKPLLQCTDPDVFYPKYDEKCKEDILFVGKTRNVYREIIKDISSTNHDFSVYGEGWGEYIDKKFIKGEFIPNDILNQYYSSCKILLNDHWDYMRDLDFPSNRLFDALACGAFVISDNINSAKYLFEDNIVTYENPEDLDKKIKFYLENDLERDKKRNEGKKIVLSKHTFDHRVEEIILTLKNIVI